jgi:hypothetical protein
MCRNRTEAYRVLPWKPEGNKLHGRILRLLKRIFTNMDHGAWTGFTWLRIEIHGK